jgi:hypothetical protein
MFGFCPCGLDLGPLFCCCCCFFFFGGALFIGVYQGIISISPWEKTKGPKTRHIIKGEKNTRQRGQNLVVAQLHAIAIGTVDQTTNQKKSQKSN